MVHMRFASSTPLEPSTSLEDSPPITQSPPVEETPPPQPPVKRCKRVVAKMAMPAISASSASSFEHEAETSDDEATEADSPVHISLSNTEQPPLQSHFRHRQPVGINLAGWLPRPSPVQSLYPVLGPLLGALQLQRRAKPRLLSPLPPPLLLVMPSIPISSPSQKNLNSNGFGCLVRNCR